MINNKFLFSLFIFFFSKSALAHLITQDGDTIKAYKEYSDKGSMSFEQFCSAEGTRLILLSGTLKIKLPKPIDMRYQPDNFYNVLVGGYQSCKNQNNQNEYFCDSLETDLFIAKQHYEFLNHKPKIEVIQVMKRGGNPYNYDPLTFQGWGRCPSGYNEIYRKIDGIKCERTVHSFDTRWMNQAMDDMAKKCKIHQDKVTSHIKKFLNW
jgi:hypothetical protein